MPRLEGVGFRVRQLSGWRVRTMTFGSSGEIPIIPDLPVAQYGPAGTVSLQNVIAGDVPSGMYPEQLASQDLVYYGPYTALYGSAFQ